MNQNEKISIIVNIYNEEKYLKQCVDSILGQTYDNLEVILVDDGSSDRCPEICRTYERADSRVKILLKENEGLVRARKAGLRLATGDIIAFVDGDDWVEPDLYETLHRAMVQNQVDVVTAAHWENLLERETISRPALLPGIYSKERMLTEVYPKMITDGKFSHFGVFSYVWDKLWRKNVFFRSQMEVDERIFIGEDAASVYPALLQAGSIQILDYSGYHYRQRGRSMVKVPYDGPVEHERMRLLYQYLRACFQRSEHAALVMPQLGLYMLSQIFVRTDGLTENNSHRLFPFDTIRRESHIAVWGAGTFGQHLCRRVAQSQFCSVAVWVDEAYEQYQQMGMTVCPPETLMKEPYDQIVVAYIDETVADQIQKKLSEMGIPAEKVAPILCPQDVWQEISRVLE